MRTKNLEMLNVHRQYVADYLRQDHYHCWQASDKQFEMRKDPEVQTPPELIKKLPKSFP